MNRNLTIIASLTRMNQSENNFENKNKKIFDIRLNVIASIIKYNQSIDYNKLKNFNPFF